MEFHNMPGYLIRRAHQLATQLFQQRVKEAGFDLTSVQFAAMIAIKETPGIDQASISAQIAYDRATIGGVIDRLEKKGWIARRVSMTDKRAREVTLTPDGEHVLLTVLPLVRALQAEVFPGLSPAEYESLTALLRKSMPDS